MTAVRLFMYERSLEAVSACEAIARLILRARPDLADQLRRASCAIPLNIAEGSDEFRPREKVRLYRIARRSAAEACAVLDVLERVIDPAPDVGTARRLLADVSGLITSASVALERRATESASRP